MTRHGRLALWIGFGALGVMVLLIGLVAWLLNTPAGTRWAFARASALTDGALQAERIDGTLAGPLTLTGLSYADAQSGIDFKAERIELDIALLELFGMTAHITTAQMQGIALVLSEPAEPPSPKDNKPFTLDAPLDIVIDRFALERATVSNDGQPDGEEPLLQIDSAAFAGQWIGSAVAVRQLDVQSPQGHVHFTANVSQGEYYDGEGRGRFRWGVGTRTFAGSLEANARNALTAVRVELTAPLNARVNVELQQRDTLPWKFTLDAPTFDPRDELVPDSSLQSLAAKLNGEGSLHQGVIAGVLEINKEEIQMERVHWVRQTAAVDLDTIIKLGGGHIAAKGTVRTAQAPASASVQVAWSDVVVPAVLAGQELLTRGDIQFDGSAETYRANGKLNIGPAERVAELELRLQGTPQRVQVEQLDIVQEPGRFALKGHIDLQPNIAWAMQAQAREFDPGAFAAAWRGSLDFDLVTDGSMPEAGPQGTLVVSNLKGRLRNRDLSGRVNLAMSPGMVIAGELDLTSGQSRVQLVGQRGETMNAVATIEVPSVNDWLPSGGGELRGRIEAEGRWPELNVAGRLRGNALKVPNLQAEAIDVRWNIDQPTDPSGSATIEGSKVLASGFEFATVRAQAEGDSKRHTLDFAATGEPLAAAFFVEGARAEGGWAGTLQRLKVHVKDAANLTLQQPVQVTYTAEWVKMSEACFADGEIRLCLEGARAGTGALHARYNLQNVPLGLANTFAPPSMPLAFAGTIDGRGNIESTAEGVFNGTAEIRSASGRISRTLEDDIGEPELLLSYADLSIVAQLEGANANAQLGARLNDTGALRGQVALRGLAEPVTNVEGDLSAHLPSLRVIEVFAPQLANVQGRADLRGNVRGTLDDPQIGGELRLSELASDVPEVGLKLRDGHLLVTPSDNDTFRIAGGIASGPGRIDFQGDATTAGTIDLTLKGKQFQAADIPSATVIIAPDLEIERIPERTVISGTLHIPTAKIDLQKLPRKERTQGASSDVVVVDARTQDEAQEEQAQAIPLSAEINVILGEKVTLGGYGLDARVFGRLGVSEQPGSPTTGSGEVRVEGTYKAYGQDLTIRQGQLLFAGTPLDNPRLNIVAVREVDEVTAGLRITGSAQNPVLTVFSDPAMGQSDALAYLVTGKPLSEVGQGDATEGDTLQMAARSLGTAAGGLLAKSIGKRLGVDEVGIKDSETIGGAALTVGQYLSPRLYLSYGVGLFEPGEVITLRYKLSRTLAVEALNGPEYSRAGVEYRKER